MRRALIVAVFVAGVISTAIAQEIDIDAVVQSGTISYEGAQIAPLPSPFNHSVQLSPSASPFQASYSKLYSPFFSPR